MCGVSPVQAASVFTPLVGSGVPKHALRVAPRLGQSQMDLDGHRQPGPDGRNGPDHWYVGFSPSSLMPASDRLECSHGQSQDFGADCAVFISGLIIVIVAEKQSLKFASTRLKWCRHLTHQVQFS